METVAVYTGVLAKAIGEKVAATPTRTLIRRSVACITEGLLFNECLASVGSACQKTATTAATLSKVIKNAGYATEITSDVLEPVAAGVGEIGELQPSRLQTWLNQIENTAKKFGNKEIIKVGNIQEFFAKTKFGQILKNYLDKTKKVYDGKAIYRVKENLREYGLAKGDQLYLDNLHKDHLEVFRKNGQFKTVLNLDGTYNTDKISKAFGRRI